MQLKPPLAVCVFLMDVKSVGSAKLCMKYSSGSILSRGGGCLPREMVAARGPQAPLGGGGVGAEGSAMLAKGKPWAIPARGGAASRWGGETVCGAGGGEESARGLLPWLPCLRRGGECGEGPGSQRAAGGEGWRVPVSAFCKAKFLRYRAKGLKGGRGRAAPLLSWKLRGSSGGSVPPGGRRCLTGSGERGREQRPQPRGQRGDSAFVRNTAALPA